MAGCLAGMADSMLLFAPNLNSYRRFQRGSHAPMAPCWGYENRTVSLRVPARRPAATRIEHRVAGADAQPYLVMAAMLAGILHGIEDRLEAPAPLRAMPMNSCRPACRVTGRRRWPDLSASEFVRENLGADFQQVYTVLKQQELDEFDRQVRHGR